MEEFELEPGENIVRSVRKHWLVFVGMLLPYVLLALLPGIVSNVLHNVSQGVFEQFLATTIPNTEATLRVLTGVWWLVLWIGAFNAFTSYFLNVWVITSHRIVKIHQFGFFDRKVSSFLLVRVQDVTTTVDGFFADIFGFGTVQVETAGTASNQFIMDGVADPVGMRDLIMREIALLHKTPGSGV